MLIVKVLGFVLLVTTMFGAGLTVDLSRLRAVLNEYGLLARAFLANFVLLPAFAVIVVRAMHVDPMVAAGIVLMSMAPGVPFLVNSAGRKQGGSMAFALTISFVFPAISVLTIPLTIALLSPQGYDVAVPYAKVLAQLAATQLVPLIVGAWLATRLSEPAIEKTDRITRIIFIIAAIAAAVVLLPKLAGYLTSIAGYGHLAVMAIVALFAAAAGWLLGGADVAYRRTLSIATLMRNVGLCLSIATAAFPDSLVVSSVLSYFIIAFVVSMPIRIFYARSEKKPAPPGGAVS